MPTTIHLFRKRPYRRLALALLACLALSVAASACSSIGDLAGIGKRSNRNKETGKPERAVLQDSTSSASERRIALVIGNSDYKSSPLRNPVNDARDVSEALRALKFEVITLLDADSRATEEAIRGLGQRLRGGGVGLFYYAGHGVQVGGQNYLVPVGARIEKEQDIRFEAVDAGRVLAEMEAAGNGMNILILDACRNNPFARSFRSVSDGLAQMNAPTGTLIAFATAPNRTAADGTGRNSVYTQHLLAYLKQPGLKIEDLFKQVRVGVLKVTANRQEPWELSSLTGDFYFQPLNAVPAAGLVRPSAPGAVPDMDGVIKEREAAQKNWQEWQQRMEAEYAKALRYDWDDRLKPQEKAAAWSAFLAGFGDNNPVSEKDDDLRQKARERLEHWQSPQQPGSSGPASGVQPSGNRMRNSIGQEFVLIPAGTFVIGSPSEEPGRSLDDEEPHQTTLTRPYYLQTTEVTQEQYMAVMGFNPSRFLKCGGDCPVEQVSWDEAQEFIRRLNAREGTGRYRLPTEAEWEYAARGGTTTALYTGPIQIQGQYDAPALDDIAWYGGNSCVDYEGGLDRGDWRETQYSCRTCGTHPAGKKRPNAYGLHDMLGNVWEWCSDFYGMYPTGAVTDPTGAPSGTERVLRGGAFTGLAKYSRAATRLKAAPSGRQASFGFRLAMNY